MGQSIKHEHLEKSKAGMQDATALLSSVFGFPEFRPGQEEIVRAVAEGRNVLAIMPTGGGKSLCFQLPALMREGVTVVISPLIALMRDQVRGLREAGVEAGALTSGNTPEETDAVWEALEAGRLKLLYIFQLIFRNIGLGSRLSINKGRSTQYHTLVDELFSKFIM